MAYVVSCLQEEIGRRTHAQKVGDVAATSPAPETFGRADGLQKIGRRTLMAAGKGICKAKTLHDNYTLSLI